MQLSPGLGTDDSFIHYLYSVDERYRIFHFKNICGLVLCSLVHYGWLTYVYFNVKGVQNKCTKYTETSAGQDIA